MNGINLRMLVLASAAAMVTGYPLVASNKRYGTWLPFRAAHPPPTYLDPYVPPTQEDLVDFYYQSPEPVHYYQLPYYYNLPEYYYETPEEEEEPEQWYVGNNAEANALFLQNLMLAQLYSRAQKEGLYNGEKNWPRLKENDDENTDETEDEDESGTYIYGEPVKAVNQMPKEDRDVRELKSLVENRWVDKREQGDRILARKHARQDRKPSAYDALKKLLIQQEKKDSNTKQPHKRSYIPNEDSLVEQLGSLKKI